MDDRSIGVIFLCIGICSLLLLIYKKPKSELPGLPTFQGIVAFIFFIIMGILLLIGKIKL